MIRASLSCISFYLDAHSCHLKCNVTDRIFLTAHNFLENPSLLASTCHLFRAELHQVGQQSSQVDAQSACASAGCCTLTPKTRPEAMSIRRHTIGAFRIGAAQGQLS